MYIMVVSYGCPSDKYPQNGIFQIDQAKALFEYGHKVVFASIDLRSIRKWRRWGLNERECSGLPVIEFNFPMGPVLPNLKARISQIGFRRILRRAIIKYGKPDIIHVHFGNTAKAVVEICKKENIPFVVTEHSSDLTRNDLNETEILQYRYVYQNAAAVIAVSTSLAEQIRHYSGVKATVIPNIIDLSVFSCCHLSHDGYRFVSAGNLKSLKGFDTLLKAFRLAIDNGIVANLLIMGDGPDRARLEKMVKELGLQDKVSFFGTYVRSQFADELSRSDAFVLASRVETFGVVYAEAMACGVPVIATRCGGPEDFVNDNNGVLVEVDDVMGLAEAIINMKERSSYDANAISSDVNMWFSSRTIAEKIDSVLLKVVKEF